MSQKSNRVSWTLNIIAYWGMFCTGMIIGSLGPLLVPISDFFELKIAQISYPVVFNSLGFLLAGFIVSFIWQLGRARLLLTSCSLSLVLGLVGFVFLHVNIVVILTLLFLVGLSKGILHTGLDSLFSEIYEEKRAKYLNILHVFFTVGAFAGPLLVGAILAYVGRWYLVFFSMGFIALPLPVFLCRRRLYKDIKLSHPPNCTHRKWAKEPVGSILFWPIVAAMFLYVGVESALTSWTPLFLTRIRNISTIKASYSMSIFWFMMIGGRGIFGHFLHEKNLPPSLVLGASGAALFIALTYWTRGVVPIVIFLACSGLLLSFFYPSLIALGGQVFPKYIGFVTGVLASSGSIGHIFFPWLIGHISDILGLSKGVFAIPLLCIVMAIISICFGYFLIKTGG